MVAGSEGLSSSSLLFAIPRILGPLLTPVNFYHESVIGPCPHPGQLPWLGLVLRAPCRSRVNLYRRKFPDGTIIWTSPIRYHVSEQPDLLPRVYQMPINFIQPPPITVQMAMLTMLIANPIRNSSGALT